MATAATRAPTKSPATQGLFSSPGNRRVVLSLLLALLTLVVYNPVAHNGFVNFDDPAYITGNQHVTPGLTWETIKWAFDSTEQANWHPVTWLSHALDCQLFHLKPAGHHYVNLLLHIVNAVILFLLLERATGFAWRSIMVAAFFAIHPINVESIAWASERKNVLCTLFFLLGIAAYGWYVRNPGIRRYLAVFALFALGLMSKPMVITFPFVLLLLDYWPLGRMNLSRSQPGHGSPGAVSISYQTRITPISRLLLEKLPLLALSAGSAIITMVVQKSGGAIHSEHPFSDRLQNVFVSYCSYIEKAFWPSHLAVMYPHPGNALPAWEVTASAIFLFAVTAAALILRRQRYLAVGWLWFLGTLIPMIGLVQVGEQAMADRYAYIPLIGLFIAVVWALADYAGAKRLPSAYPAAACIVAIAGLSVMAHTQVGYWRDSTTLWTHALAVTQGNFVAHDNMGAELLEEGKIQEAAAQFQAAAEVNPRDAFSQLDLGVCDKLQGNVNGAIQHYRLALQLSSAPTLRANAYANLGSIYRLAKDYSPALENFRAAIQLSPENETSLVGMALIAQKTGDLPQAVDFYTKAASVQPSGLTYFLLGQALAKSGRNRDAQAAFNNAQQMIPDLESTQAAANHLLQE